MKSIRKKDSHAAVVYEFSFLFILLPFFIIPITSQAFPFYWDPYLRYLNVQVEEADVPEGGTYWRVMSGDAIPPPDEGFGDVKIWVQTQDENGHSIGGIPLRFFSAGGTIQLTQTPAEFIMGGGNWIDFYNQIGPYWLAINDGRPTEVCKGLGLPVNQHFSYTIVFQRAIKGVTPTAPQPTKLGKPDGINLLTNPGAEDNFRGWSQQGMIRDGDIYNNVGNRAGAHRFSWQTFGSGNGRLEQSVSVTPGKKYTFGFWVAKKSKEASLSLNASWSDNGGGSGTLYQMPTSETIFPIYGTRQDAVFIPKGNSVTVVLTMNYSGAEFAAFHLDEFWLVELPPDPPTTSSFMLY